MGEIEVKMPKLRKQTCETAIIERYHRRDISIEEAIFQMYLAWVSARRVEDIQKLCGGCEFHQAGSVRLTRGYTSTLNIGVRRAHRG